MPARIPMLRHPVLGTFPTEGGPEVVEAFAAIAAEHADRWRVLTVPRKGQGVEVIDPAALPELTRGVDRATVMRSGSGPESPLVLLPGLPARDRRPFVLTPRPKLPDQGS